jgi:hypothetical protein
MRSNSSDVDVADAMDCGSGGGRLAQSQPDRCSGGVIGAVGRSGGGRIRRQQPNQHGGGVDLTQGQSADAGDAS